MTATALTREVPATLARTYAAETEGTKVRVNLFSPGPTRTRMHRGAYPGVDPETLPTPEEVADKIVPLCGPEFIETGKVYDPRSGRLKAFRRPE